MGVEDDIAVKKGLNEKRNMAHFLLTPFQGHNYKLNRNS